MVQRSLAVISMDDEMASVVNGNDKTSLEIPEMSREELQKRLKTTSLMLVDVLPVESYASGHIPGAISLPLEDFASHAADLLPDRHAEIVVYCGKFT
jgi:rhodanese-related sulfurtransferase